MWNTADKAVSFLPDPVQVIFARALVYHGLTLIRYSPAVRRPSIDHVTFFPFPLSCGSSPSSLPGWDAVGPESCSVLPVTFFEQKARYVLDLVSGVL